MWHRRDDHHWYEQVGLWHYFTSIGHGNIMYTHTRKLPIIAISVSAFLQFLQKLLFIDGIGSHVYVRYIAKSITKLWKPLCQLSLETVCEYIQISNNNQQMALIFPKTRPRLIWMILTRNSGLMPSSQNIMKTKLTYQNYFIMKHLPASSIF
jgi:hypothetical protein